MTIIAIQTFNFQMEAVGLIFQTLQAKHFDNVKEHLPRDRTGTASSAQPNPARKREALNAANHAKLKAGRSETWKEHINKAVGRFFSVPVDW